jgi:O-antigen/teichoic acid export membrane protein
LGTFWNAIAATTTQGSVFLANLIVARLLGQTAFGEFSIVYVTMVAASGIAQVATGVTATKYVAEFRDVDKHRAGRVLGLCSLISLVGGAVMTLVVVVSAPWLASQVLNAPHLAAETAVGAGFLWFTAITGYQQGALAGLESYRRLAQVSLVHGAAHVGAVASSAYWWGLTGTVIALVGSAALRWLLFNAALRNEALRLGITISHRNAIKERQIVQRFALPAAIAGFSSLPAVWLANALLVQQPGGYAQMGLFSAANSLKNLVLFLPALTNNVGQALLNNQKGWGDQRRYTKVFWVNTAATALLLIVVAAAVALAGQPLLRLYGPGFVEGYPILAVLLLAAVLDGMATATYQVVQSQERMWLSLFGIAVPRDFVLLAAAYVLTTHGGFGLAVAFAISAAFGLFATIFAAQRIGLRVSATV